MSQWLVTASGDQSLFIRTIDLRVGEVHRFDFPAGKVTPLSVRGQGPMCITQDGRRALGQFSVNGFPNQLTWLSLSDLSLSGIVGLPKDHRTRFGEAFTLTRDGRMIVYALHPDRPGEQTGNRGPAATLWLYDIEGQQSSRSTRMALIRHSA